MSNLLAMYFHRAVPCFDIGGFDHAILGRNESFQAEDQGYLAELASRLDRMPALCSWPVGCLYERWLAGYTLSFD